MSWGVRSEGGIVTEAPNEEKARHWAKYDFKGRLGEAGERLVKLDPSTAEWKEES